MNSDSNNSMKHQKPGKGKRIAALAGALFLVAMVVATLLAAILASPGSNIFRTLLGFDITIPSLLWLIIYAADHMPGKRHGVYEEETKDPKKTSKEQDSTDKES